MGRGAEPTPEQMEKAAEAVRFSKTVRVTDIQVRTFDLSNEEQVEQYRDTYLEVYEKVSLAKALITVKERVQVNDPQPRWIVHLEWVEYELNVKDHMKKP
jgi:hypothetical protein